jgi:hypothetical protein
VKIHFTSCFIMPIAAKLDEDSMAVACWPDILHVALKVIVEKNLSWSLAIVYGFHRIGGEQWQDSMAVLDARVENFAVVPNFEGIRLYSFPDCLMIGVDQPTLHVIPGGSAFARVSPVF